MSDRVYRYSRDCILRTVFLTIWCVLSCFSLVGCNGNARESNALRLQVATGQVQVSPRVQTKYLFGFSQRSATIEARLPLPAKIAKPIDVLLLFDHTNSMKDLIDATASSARGIVDEIQESASDVRFAVGAFADYPLFNKEPGASAWDLMQSFSQDAGAISEAIGRIAIANGGDNAEAYTRALYEAGLVPWRAEAQKIVILFGDSTEHEVDPGPDGKLGTPDDLHLQEVINHLAEMGVMVIGIHARSEGTVTAMFQKIAQETGGSAFPLRAAKDAPQLLKTALLNKLFPTFFQCEPQGELKAWVTSVRSEKNIKGTRHDCTLNIYPPKAVQPGRHRVPVLTRTLYGEEAVSGNVEISVVTGWYNFPFFLFLPLLLWLIIMLLPLFRARRNYSYNLLGPGPPDMDRYGARWFFGDFLFWVAMGLVLIQVYLFLHGNMVFSDFWR